MEKIASFTVNHKNLTPGLYISRIDGDIVTYDLRMRRPNVEPVVSNAALHSFEHLMATVLRSGPEAGRVIYFGPMGCRTGCYVLLRGCDSALALKTVQEALAAVAVWNGPLPGNTADECGNYREHDLTGAVREAAAMADTLKNWTVEKMTYRL